MHLRKLTFVSLVLLVLQAFGQTGGQTILVLGDSISAAYGMEQEQGWVHLLDERLQQLQLDVKVINASVSGDTTVGGLARLPIALEHHEPDIVIIELGGNDGLRGYPVARIRENLSQLIEFTEEAGAKALLVGMKIPPNYGRRYTDAFHQVFAEVGKQHNVAVLPFFLERVATDKKKMQPDGIHPTADAQPLLLEEIWPLLEPMIKGP